MNFPNKVSNATYLHHEYAAKGASPVTLAEAKAHARVIDNADDAIIAAQLQSATTYVETLIKSPLMSVTCKLYLDRFPSDGTIRLPAYPARSVTSVQYKKVSQSPNLITLASNQYVLTPWCPASICLSLTGIYPEADYNPPDFAVVVSYLAGYATTPEVPDPLKQAVLLMFTHWYDNSRAATTTENLKEAPHAVEMITRQYVQTRWTA